MDMYSWQAFEGGPPQFSDINLDHLLADESQKLKIQRAVHWFQ